MLCNRWVSVGACVAVVGIGVSAAWGQITIPTVHIGDPGNAANTVSGARFGAVAYEYNIGATEVTIGQYAAFLNAVAQTDANNLYNPAMADVFAGGLLRSGGPGSYVYTPANGRASFPVNYVSFWDAVRFANWLHNGQPTGEQNAGTTEDGAYTLTAGGISGNTVVRNAGWRWAVPSENEWFKAAYYQPGSGGPGTYWTYPVGSNTIGLPQANIAGGSGTTRAVGSYPANNNGAFDMGGNVWEWDELVFNGANNRGIRGGSYNTDGFDLRAANRVAQLASREANDVGFRVVQIPPPACAADFNRDGVVDPDDLSDFITGFFSLPPVAAADFNHDGVIDPDDLSDFITTYFGGC